MLLQSSSQPFVLLIWLSCQFVGPSNAASSNVNPSIDVNSTQLSMPPTPGFSLSEKVLGIPGQEFQLINMLHLTNNLMRVYAVRPYNEEAPGKDIYIPRAGNLILGTARSPQSQPSQFLNYHALWGLWKGANQTVHDRDFRTGRYEFKLAGVPHRIGGVIYQLETSALANATISGSNASTDGSESVLTAALDTDEGQSSDVANVATTKRSAAGTAAANANFTQDSILYKPPSIPANASNLFNDEYALILTDFGEPLNRLKIFFTIYECLLDRASKPDRYTFLDRNYEYVASTGYRIGYRPSPESTVVPEYGAIIFGLSTLVESMLQHNKFVELWFHVVGEELVSIFDCYIIGAVGA